jgi:hypothetical protein
MREMTISAKAAIAVSWAMTMTVGCVFVAGYWVARGSAGAAVVHGLLFAVIMTFIHVLGYHAYAHQAERGGYLSAALAPALISAARASLLQQGAVLVLAALVLDGGRTFHAALIAAMAYWLGLAVVVVRRPSSPTAVDVFLVKYGFLFVLLIVLTVGPMIWGALGRW